MSGQSIARCQPRIGTTLYWDKPLLSYWQALPGAALLGDASRFAIRLPSALWALALLALGAFVAYLAYFGWQVLETSWSLSAKSNSALKVPMWIPQALWFAGLALFGCQSSFLVTANEIPPGCQGTVELIGIRNICPESIDFVSFGTRALAVSVPLLFGRRRARQQHHQQQRRPVSAVCTPSLT